MTRRTLLILVAIGLVTAGPSARQAQDRLTPDLLKGIELRSIGPALTTGRVVDVKIDPKNPSVWYVVTAFGGLWKTTNRGITFTPIFDGNGVVHPLLRRHRPEGLERPLARHRREQQPAQRAFRRRHLQVDRRRQDVEARGPRDVGAHRRDRHRPAQLERRLRGLAGTALFRGRRARALQDDRRRRPPGARS